MKPKPIVLFDWLFWIALIAGATIHAGEGWTAVQSAWASPELRNTVISGAIFGLVFVYGIPIWLWSLISLAGNNIARWVYAALVGIFVVFSTASWLISPDDFFLALAGLLVLDAIKVACLFVPGTAPWFFSNRERVQIDARTFE